MAATARTRGVGERVNIKRLLDPMNCLHSLVIAFALSAWFVFPNTAAATALSGQDSVWRNFDRPRFVTLTTADGLPSDSVSALAQDTLGFLWIGTGDGLSRYDGQRLETLRPGSGNGLPDGYIRALLPLVDGRLLVGTTRGGLLTLDTSTLQFTRLPLGAPQQLDGKIFALRQARDGGVWVATADGAYHFDPRSDAVTAVPLAGFPSGHSPRIFDVAEDSSGRLWLAGNPGLFMREAGAAAFQPVHAPDGRTDGLIWSLHLDAGGRLWVGTDTRGALMINPDQSIVEPEGVRGQGGLAKSATIRGFLENEDGSLWISTYGRGVIVCQDASCDQPKSLRAVRNDHGSLATDMVRSMLRDRIGNIWIGTNRGVSMMRAAPPAVFIANAWNPQFALRAGEGISAIMTASDGRVWLGMQSGEVVVADLAADSVAALARSDFAMETSATTFAQAADGTIWVGGLGVAGFDPKTLRKTNDIPQLSSARITALAAGPGELVIGTYDGTFRYSGADAPLQRIVVPQDATSGPSLQAINQSVILGRRRWFAAVNGLGVGDIGAQHIRLLQHHDKDPLSLPGNFVFALAADPSHDRLWVATEGGLAWIADAGKTDTPQFHSVPALAHGPINNLALDASGNVWAVARDGLLHIDAQSLQVQQLGIVAGALQHGFKSGAAAAGPSNSVLLGSSDGLVVVLPDRFDASMPATGPLRITRVEVDGVPRFPPAENSRQITLDPQQRNISVDFSLLNFRAPREIEYAYRLLGFESAWHQIAAGTPATATYTNLPSGDFRLELRASIRIQKHSSVSQTFEVNVVPRWYETWRGRAVQALALLLLAAMLVYLVLLWSRYRQRVLDQLISQRTHQLRVANTQLELLATTDALTGLSTRRYFMEQATRLVNLATSNGDDLAMLLMDLDHFKSINDTHGHLAGDQVLAACGAAIRKTCREGDIIGRYGGEEIIICLPGADAHQACRLAERLRAAIASLEVAWSGTAIRISCTIGVALHVQQGGGLPALLRDADAALYRAKRAGRNRVDLAVVEQSANGPTEDRR